MGGVHVRVLIKSANKWGTAILINDAKTKHPTTKGNIVMVAVAEKRNKQSWILTKSRIIWIKRNESVPSSEMERDILIFVT